MRRRAPPSRGLHLESVSSGDGRKVSGGLVGSGGRAGERAGTSMKR